MKKRILYIVWACLYVLCVGMGTLENPEGVLKGAMVALAVLFFVPGAFLLWDAIDTGDRKTVRTVRWISIASLALTLVGLLSFVVVGMQGSERMTLVYDLLLLVSSPMICGQFWIMSLFLWGCLLFASFLKKSEKK